VRNYAARNNMRLMKRGDLGFFYHSNTKTPGVVGICRIVKEAYPDDTAWEPGHPYFDAKSAKDAPRWDRVDVEFVERLPRMVSLAEIKGDPALAGMQLLTRARLSVSEVAGEEWGHIVALASSPAPAVAVTARRSKPRKAEAGFAAFVRKERAALAAGMTAKEKVAALSAKWESLTDEGREEYRQ